MPGPYASYIRDTKQAHAVVQDFQRRKARNRAMDHGHWVFSQRRKKQKQRHRDTIAAASRKQNRR